MMLAATTSRDGTGHNHQTNPVSHSTTSHPSSSVSPLIDVPLPFREDSNHDSNFDNSESADADTDTDTDDAVSHVSVASDGHRPEGWTTGLYSTLKTLVKEAKGAASKPVVRLRGTKLIFVVGQTGTGKSSLLRDITGQDITVGETHKSGTKNYQVCPAVLDGEQYLFVDTAGFGAHDIKDVDNFYDIMSCLDALAPFVTIAGILLVYGGTQERMHTHDLATIRWVKCFCGPEFYRHVTIVSTKWDSLEEESFKEYWDKFSGVVKDPAVADILNPVASGTQRYHGGSVYHHGVVMDEANPGVPLRRLSKRTCADQRAVYARAMIRDRYSSKPNAELQILREMAAGVAWYETEAAKVLRNSHLTLKLDVCEDLLRVTVVRDEPPPELNTRPKSARTATTLRPFTPALPPPPGESNGPWTEKPQRSWYQRLWEWLEKAKEAAAFFQEQRRMAAASAEPTAWVRLAGSLRNWWSGSRKSDADEGNA